MSWLSSLRLILTLRCEESSRLMSEALDRGLPWAERWAVRLHFLGCKSCRRFRRQLQFLRLAAGRRVAPGGMAPRPGTAEAAEVRRRLEATLRKQADQ